MLNNRKYNYDNAAANNDVINTEFVKKLDLKSYQVDLKFDRGIIVKKRFAQKIFVHFLQMVIADMIENNITFIAPSKGWFTLAIEEMTPQSVDRILNNDKIYMDTDLIASDMKFYEVKAYFSFGKRYRSVRISKYMYQKIVKKVNKGQRYYPAQKKKMIDYLEVIESNYPGVPKDKIKSIIIEGCNQINREISKGRDVCLTQKKVPFRFVIYKPNFHPIKNGKSI